MSSQSAHTRTFFHIHIDARDAAVYITMTHKWGLSISREICHIVPIMQSRAWENVKECSLSAWSLLMQLRASSVFTSISISTTDTMVFASDIQVVNVSVKYTCISRGLFAHRFLFRSARTVNLATFTSQNMYHLQALAKRKQYNVLHGSTNESFRSTMAGARDYRVISIVLLRDNEASARDRLRRSGTKYRKRRRICATK